MLQFRLLGIPVTVQPWHWIMLGLFGAIIYNPTNKNDLLNVALFVLAGFVSVLVHEYGHALTGRRYGTRPEIVLHGIGGVALFPYARFTRGQNILVSAAGPLIQIVLGVIALGLLFLTPLPDTPIRTFIYLLGFFSILWAVLNLIPVYPLDGGQIMMAIMGPHRRRLGLQISIGTAVIAGLGLFLVLHSFIFPFFLGIMAYQNYQELQQWR